jgi:hypothetical protein
MGTLYSGILFLLVLFTQEYASATYLFISKENRSIQEAPGSSGGDHVQQQTGIGVIGNARANT